MKKFTLYIFFLSALSQLSFGKYWEEVDLPAGYDNNLYLDVYFLKSNPNFGWVCGFNGKVLRTTNRGRTWTGVTIPGADHLENIHFSNSSYGLTSGPAGVYRSTDGGASWTEVTPDIGGSYWGNYVESSNVAMVIGGGCVGNQEFWRTTDGGSSWSLDMYTVPNSGLTDIKMIVQGGLGFATSSGLIWLTEDGGLTWEVLASSGTNIWQEEISYSGGSFLVPYAGNNCQGSSIGGGMRFSGDYGQSWRDYSIGIPMYGSFLNSDSEGWGCGVDEEVVYTSDRGQSWNLFNCGIAQGDLDDIWFINDNEGFVVGHGVYKLSDPVSEVSPLSISNEEYCINEVRYDTVKLKNYSFYNENVNLEIINNDSGVFRIVSPASNNFTVLSCDRETVIIETSSPNQGTFNAVLLVTYKPGEGSLEEVHQVTLEATIIESTAEPETNNVVIDQLYCNTPNDYAITWSSLNFHEEITDVVQQNKNPDYSFGETTPVELNSTTRNINYHIVLKDTGWSEEVFYHELEPCDDSEEITFRVYGFSSIINGPDEFNFSTECNEPVLDSIPITNTGNYELEIEDVYLLGNNTEIYLMGWDNPNLNETIAINETKYLKIRYDAIKSGSNSYILRFINNDSTKVNGNKNPFDVRINTTNENVALSARDTVIYLDSVCIDDEASGIVVIRNYGSEPASLFKPDLKDGFSIFSVNQFPLNIDGNDSVSFNILYKPEVPGPATDTLVLNAEPCSQTVNVIVHGFGKYTELNAIPDNIGAVIQSLEVYRDTILIENGSNIPVTINNVSITPNPQNIDFSFTPALPVTLNPFEDFELIVEYSAITDTTYSGEIIIDSEADCDVELKIPVDIISQSRFVKHTPVDINFGVHICEFPDVTQEIVLQNEGVKNDTIISYELRGDAENFELFGFDTPMEIDDELSFHISFHPDSEGVFETEIIIKTKDPNGQTIAIPIVGYFYKSVINLIGDNFAPLEIVEHCDDTLKYSFRFSNSGLLNDTLITEDITQYGGFYIKESMQEIKSKDTVQFDFYIVPSELENAGIYDNKIEVHSLVCDTTILLNILVELIEPRLDYDPKEIIIENLWMRDSVTSSFTISNNTDYRIYVSDFFALKPTPEIVFDKSPGFYLDAGESEVIGISYIAANEGTLNNTVRIIESRNCTDSNFVDIEIEVEEEIYRVDLFIDEYEANPGDKVNIEMLLTDSVYKFYPEYTTLGVEFNERLFYPENVSIRNGDDYQTVDYEVQNGILSVSVDEAISKELFAQKGIILNIYGTALAYVPNSTELIVANPDFLPDNLPVVFTTDDGLLTVVDFCEPEAQYNRFVPLAIQIAPQSVYFDNIVLEIISDNQYEIEYKLFDNLGTVKTNGNYKLNNGSNSIVINSDYLPSGNYHLKITDGNRVYIKKIMLVK